MEKNNEIQLTKNKMDLNNRKMTNHPPPPNSVYYACILRNSSLFINGEGMNLLEMFLS